MRHRISTIVSFGGIMAALTVIFHSAPVFLPYIGMVISPMSTLPVTIAVEQLGIYGIVTYLSSAFILMFISTQEALIFLFTTGLLGLVLGFLLHKNGPVTTITAGIVLFAGISTLVYLIGIPVFGDFPDNRPFGISLSVFLLFSLFYSTIWRVIAKKAVRIVHRILRRNDALEDM